VDWDDIKRHAKRHAKDDKEIRELIQDGVRIHPDSYRSIYQLACHMWHANLIDDQTAVDILAVVLAHARVHTPVGADV